MLKVENTTSNLGVTISGDFEDLYELYEAIERIIGLEGEYNHYDMVQHRLFGICYDLRHCYQGDREVRLVPNEYSADLAKYHHRIHGDTNLHYSVNILWTEMVFFILTMEDYYILRKNPAKYKLGSNAVELRNGARTIWQKTLNKDIAHVRFFSELIWEALGEFIGEGSQKRLYKEALLQKDSTRPQLKYPDYLIHYIDVLNMDYIYSTHDKRGKMLAKIMRQIIRQNDPAYLDLYKMVMNHAKEEGVSPLLLQLKDVEYPETMEW